MESQQFNYKKDLLQSENFGFKKYLKALYRGEVIDGKRQGKGVIVYEPVPGGDPRGIRVYEGEWTNDQRNGNGYERFNNGGIYVGEFKHNKPDG
jgi:hypothetical protein